jgi:hypothetical protein
MFTPEAGALFFPIMGAIAICVAIAVVRTKHGKK